MEEWAHGVSASCEDFDYVMKNWNYSDCLLRYLSRKDKGS